MIQAKFSIDESNINFINNFKAYGFKDKSTLVRFALELMKKNIEINQLKQSADLYKELYDKDEEIQLITESAISGWPE